MERNELIALLRICMEKAEEVSLAHENWERVKAHMETLNTEPQKGKPPQYSFSTPAAVIGFLCTVVFGAIYLLLPRMREWMAEETLRPLVAICIVVVMTAAVALGAGVLAGRAIQNRNARRLDEEHEERLRQWKRQKAAENFALRQELHKFEEQRNSAARTLNEAAQRCGLHPKYHDKRYLEHVIKYLETGRADTLKESLNLLDTDMERYRQKKEREVFRESIEALVREELWKLREELKRDLRPEYTASVIADTAAAGLGGEEEDTF